ncbi:tryptophan 7-halogenase [Haloferula sargassicola]|uniref:Flavin-dependent tryptophan halogenase RebH n=1 Tax=Haloferula sargassicola TaxID=490096 RepID=A0ABP9ULY0_9BACT
MPDRSSDEQVREVLVLGGGTAGLLAALTLRLKLPSLAVRLVRSPDLGVIGVGEGTTPSFPTHLHQYLGIPLARFHELVEPTWKLGIRFLWGPRKEFHYTFATEFSIVYPGTSRAAVCYAGPGTRWTGAISALMRRGKACFRGPEGKPRLHPAIAYHVENQRLVGGLEQLVREAGVEILDGTVAGVATDGDRVTSLRLEDGRDLRADLYLDASGFRAELIGKALGIDTVSFSDALWCDRAIIGGWPRTGEALVAHTTAETMNAGWCWQIEHEHWINRGYVYSSAWLDDDAARAEFLAKNPQVDPGSLRVVKFSSSRRKSLWVGNVVAIGNASGFVEPLEATAIQIICQQARTLAGALTDSQMRNSTPVRDLYNRYNLEQWDDVRDFLALHYRFNSRLDTPFWRAARHETPLHGSEALVDFWKEYGGAGSIGGILTKPASSFGLEGHFALLWGQDVPVRHPYEPPGAERAAYLRQLADDDRRARQGLTLREAFSHLRTPVA